MAGEPFVPPPPQQEAEARLREITNERQNDMGPVSNDGAALIKGLREALQALEVYDASDDAIFILDSAAHLTPDDAQPPISTTRLFAGAVAAGRDLLRRVDVPQSASDVAALAVALQINPALGASYEKNVAALFKTEPVAAALERLRPQWFSKNVAKILMAAKPEHAGGPLTGDAIVRTLLRNRSGLIYGRISMGDVAKEVETLRNAEAIANRGQRSLLGEVDAALGELSIRAIEDIRLRLANAAAFRSSGEEVGLLHVLWALIQGVEFEGRPLTDPSRILSWTLHNHASPLPLSPSTTPPPPNYQAPDPSNPIRFTPATKSVLQRAYDKQQKVFLNPALGAKGLVAAILTLRREEIGTDDVFEAADLSGVRVNFRAITRERLADRPEQLQQWNRALEFESASLPKLNSDQPWSGTPRDHLGITNDALAIANVAAGKATSLPLAFGIFGDWGAGKTFFMRLIHDQVAQLVKSKAEDDGFEHAIVQIQFNAWHYAETNLWASLVGHIFDELDRWMTRDQTDARASSADAILKRLATSRQLALETATELVQRRKEHAKAAMELADAQQALSLAVEKAAHEPDLAWRAAVKTVRAAVADDEELKQQLGAVQSALGVPELLEDKAKLAAVLEELNRSATATNATLGALRSTIGNRGTVLFAIAALVIVPVCLFALRQALAALPNWSGFAEIGCGLETLGGALTMAAILAHSFAGRLGSIANKFAMLRQRIDDEIRIATAAQRATVSRANAEVAQCAAGVEQAKSVLQATGDQVATALHDYAEETGGLRIRRFVRARAGNDGYGKHLGLVSTIRKDFEQLESLMLNRDNPPPHLEEARKHYEVRVKALIADAGTALTEDEIKQLGDTAISMRDLPVPAAMEFRRIVLYVDDLDRCEPEKVVEVLQAVNMLLSFRLFVVMVAVDARWLSRSLETKYRAFFGELLREDDESQYGARQSNPADSNKVGRATPADYLEKIFQVPYWIPPMTDKTSATLVADLVAPDRVTPEFGPNPLVASFTAPATSNKPPSKPIAGEDDQPQTMQTPSYALGLTDEEINALTALSPFLGGSPRRARRFINVYRVAKASLAPGELKRLEEGEFRALATQLAIATGAPNVFGVWLATCAEKSNKSLEERLSELAIEEHERQNLQGAVAKFHGMLEPGADALQRLAAQGPIAAKFSFVIPRKTSKLTLPPQ